MEMNKELSKAAEAKLEAAETLDEMVQILAEEGVEISKEELIAAMDEPEGELNENDLDNVAGGLIGGRGGCVIIGGGVVIGRWLWEILRKKRR